MIVDKFAVILTCFVIGDCLAKDAYYLKLSARELPKMDGEYDGDPYAELHLNGEKIYATEHLNTTGNPDWPEIFNLTEDTDEAYISVQLWDWECGKEDDPYCTEHIGWSYFLLNQINTVGNLTVNIFNSATWYGSLIVQTIEVRSEG